MKNNHPDTSYDIIVDKIIKVQDEKDLQVLKDFFKNDFFENFFSKKELFDKMNENIVQKVSPVTLPKAKRKI